jgi:hypothetical protein
VSNVMSGRSVEDAAAGARGSTWGSNQPDEGSGQRQASPFVEATLIRAEQSLEAEAPNVWQPGNR